MKPVVVGVMAFAISTATATGLAVVTAKKPVVPGPGVPSPAGAMPDAGKDSSHASPPADSSTTHKAVTAPVPATARPESVAVKAPPPEPASARPAVVAAKPAPPPKPGDQPAGIKHMGKVLENMKPAEAAKVLGFLSDSQVADVIGQLNPRVAGPVLAALPQERAAAVSRLILQVKGSP